MTIPTACWEILNAYPPAAYVRNNQTCAGSNGAVDDGGDGHRNYCKSIQNGGIDGLGHSRQPLPTRSRHPATRCHFSMFGMLTAKPGLVRRHTLS
jgi:hypothetical protein